MSWDFSDTAIEKALTTRYVGRRLMFLGSTTSTQEVARREAMAGAPEGLLVIAEEQSRGRGRFRRAWIAPRGTALLLSLVLRPDQDSLARMHMIASLAAVRAIVRETGLDAWIKWPNDVQISGKKVAGILVDASLKGEQVDHVIIGMGLNVSFDPAAYPEIAPLATSLSVEKMAPVSRLAVLCAFLAEMEGLYEATKAGRFPFQEWKGRLATLGKQVRVTWPGGGGARSEVHEGLAEDVDELGALLLRKADGTLLSLVAGEVSLRA